MKPNKKQSFKTNKLSQALKCVFSALVPAVFLIGVLLGSFLGLKSNYPVKRATFSYNLSSKSIDNSQNGIILQTPTEDNKWANKLKEDVNNLNYENTESLGKLYKHSFSTKDRSYNYSGSISNGYHRGGHKYGDSHTITFEFKLKVNGSYVSTGTFDQWIDDNDSHSTKWFTLSGMSKYNLKPSDSISIDLTRAYVKNDYSWSADLSIPSVVGESEFNSIVKSRLDSNTNYFNINSVRLYVNYDGSNERGYNNMKVEIRSISSAEFNITKNTTLEDKVEKSLKVKKVFMSDNDINNKQFTEDELKNLVALYIDNNLISKNNLEYAYINLDKENKNINLKLRKIKIGTSKNYYETPIKYHIPIHTVNLNYLIEGSILSSSYWEHKDNGDIQYHTNKPKTKLRLSENFLKALYIFGNKEKLLKRIKNDNWGFVGNDKQIAIAKINDLSLNIDNYNQIKNDYSNSHDILVISKLSFDDSLDKYVNIFKNVKFEDYLYILKNIKGSLEFGIENFEEKIFNLGDVIKGISIKISDAESRLLDTNRTNWSMHIKNLKIINEDFNWSINNNWAFDLPNDNFQNYDLNLNYEKSNRELIHKYLYQAHGIDISQNISFVMEDGTILDQDFKVVKVSSESDLKINDEAFVAIRYWTKFSSGQEEYVTITNKNGNWYSEKYGNNIIDLDSSFNENKIEYLFNQDLQLIINPYLKSSGQKITATTPQNFGIKKVTDEIEGNTKVLEDWDDGLWSHSHDIYGKATFDGIFGADVNGIFDSRGRLTQGKHHINVELQNSSSSDLKNNFFINIDKDPVQVEVKGIDSSVEKFNFINDLNQEEILYFSNGPINFKVEDIDIKSIQASFIDNQGNWYNLPINIKSKKINNNWKQIIDSTIDYGGFAKVIITDRANNKKILYFWLKQHGDQDPEINFDYSLLFDQTKRNLMSSSLEIFKDSPEIIISSPLVESLTISKQVLDKGQWKNTSINSYEINEYSPDDKNDYDFAKPIGSSKSVLKYAGDELKPFITKNRDSSWPVANKAITFKEKGLYKLTLNNRFIDNKTITKYIYIKDDSTVPIDLSLFSDEQTNFINMPKSDEGIKEDIDSTYKVSKEININFPNFLIKKYDVFYSQLWYSDFNQINSPGLNFTREGKYKIYIQDIYGEEHEYKLLLLNKNLNAAEREKLKMIQIYDPKAKITEVDNKAFWKGKMIWNFVRYEDEDHAKWEYNEFIKKAMEKGLTKDQADALYKKLKDDPDWDGNLNSPDGEPKWGYNKFIKKAMEKGLTKDQADALYKKLKENQDWGGNSNSPDGKPKWEYNEFIREAMEKGLTKDQADAFYKIHKDNPDWDGNLNSPDGKPFDFKKVYRDSLDSKSQYKRISNLPKGGIVGIVVGSSIFGVGFITFLIWFIRRRIVSKKIK